jgi:hypothetical protein
LLSGSKKSWKRRRERRWCERKRKERQGWRAGRKIVDGKGRRGGRIINRKIGLKRGEP